MRKIIKKIATVVASITMVSAMGISAFAADSYTFTGNPQLVGQEDEGNTEVGWVTVNEDQVFSAVDGQDGLYVFTGNCVVAGDKEFKIVADGADFAWNFQLCIGNPDAAWADNQSQFSGAFELGEYKVYLLPAKGFVCVIQNQKAVPLKVRYHSRDEDPANFVEIKKASIVAEGYDESSVLLDDAAYTEFVNSCVVLEGGTPEESTDAPQDDTTAANKEDDTTAANEADTTKKAESEDSEDDGISPVVIVVIVVVVVVVIAVIVALTKKKDNK